MRELPSRAQTANVHLIDVYGTPHVGLFAAVSEKILVVPTGLPAKKIDLMSSILGVVAVQTYVSGSILIGPLLCINSNGAILPKTALEDEVSALKAADPSLNIYIYNGKETAMGNMICVNDRCVILSPDIPVEERRSIADALGVEAHTMSIAGRRHVGSICLLTNRGGLVHVEASDEEIQKIEEYSKVGVMRATVNNGNLFVKSGILANGKGALIGRRTLGPELMTISTALGL
ncbi:MAG: translation initiation factor IF-6 [Nitrososphaerota archaeon]